MNRGATIGMASFLALVCAGFSRAATTPDDCHALTRHGRTADAAKCYETLTASPDPYLRAEGDWGLEMYDQANTEFRDAVARFPKNAMYRVRWGRSLLHERFNNPDAEGLFKEALGLEPNNAPAYVGLALVASEAFDGKAVGFAKKAIELDPKLVEAHELLADLALEDSDSAQAVAEADAALKISPEALDAMAVHAAVEVLADRSPDAWLAKVRQVNPTYGEAYALIGHQLSVFHYRNAESIPYYRKAIELNPRLWSAHTELGINLMRLGQEDEPKQQLEISYNNGYRNAETVNSLRLLDSYTTTTAMLWELVLTTGLVSVILGTASGAQQIGLFAAIGVGSYIALAGLWGSPVSGASMNPARSLGPALVLEDWASWWAYLVGPVAGAVVAVGIALVLRGGVNRSAVTAAQGTLGVDWRPRKGLGGNHSGD